MTPQHLRTLLREPVAFHRVFAQIGGGALPGLMLSQAWYWSQRTSDPGGWFYKTAREWHDETALSRREFESARAKLVERGLIGVTLRGVPCRAWYRVDVEAVGQAIARAAGDDVPAEPGRQPAAEPKTPRQRKRRQFVQGAQTGLNAGDNPVCTGRANQIAPGAQTKAETTAAAGCTTSETTAAPAGAVDAAADEALAGAAADATAGRQRPSVVSTLVSAGVDLGAAVQLAADHDDADVRRVLALAAKRQLRNRAGFIVKALQQGWGTPADLGRGSKEQRPAAPPVDPAREAMVSRRARQLIAANLPDETLNRVAGKIYADLPADVRPLMPLQQARQLETWQARLAAVMPGPVRDLARRAAAADLAGNDQAAPALAALVSALQPRVPTAAQAAGV